MDPGSGWGEPSRQVDRAAARTPRPGLPGGVVTVGPDVADAPADVVIARVNQVTERIIGASRSTAYGLLQAHERALREIADCRSDGPVSVQQWSQALTRAHAIFLEEVCSAYIAAAGGSLPSSPTADRQAVERIHALHARIVADTAGGARLLEGYRTVLQAAVDFSRDTLGANQLEWIAAVTGSYTRLLDELSSVDIGPGATDVGVDPPSAAGREDVVVPRSATTRSIT